MKAAIIFLLILIGFSACDTPGPLPAGTQPLVLKNGWTYHPGDRKIDELSAIGGATLDPLEDVLQFRSAYSPPSVGWLSCRFTVPANWPKQPLALTILQSVASEVYLDKQLIAKYGTIATGSQKTREYDPLLRPIPLALTPGSVHSLDVKIALDVDTKYTTLFESPNPVFQAELKPYDFALHEHTRIHTIETAFLRLNAGINLMLFVIHFFFFLLNRNQVANLFLSLAALSNILGTLLQLQYFLYTPFHTEKFFLGNIVFLFYQLANLMLFFAIHNFLERKKDIIYWFLLVYFFAALVLNAGWYDLGWRRGGALFQIVVFLNILRICWISIRQKKKGAVVFFTGAVISIICFVTFATLGTFDTDAHFLRNLSEFRYMIYMLSWLGITGSVSAFLAMDFSLTSKQLSQKLVEVHELSEKNLAVEKEKQEILASQNLQLERKVEERTRELNQSLEYLKATQAQLIQSEKMASLGELTAGIAHEIQNPLNFVNNFAEVNTELNAEGRDALKSGHWEDAEEIMSTLAENNEKILQHGKRADAIVKGMLQHSRTSTGMKEPTDINALVDEYLRLAYHGMRAKDKSFNADYIFTPDPSIGKVNVVPQDVGRVILNLVNNSFYAVQEKSKSGDANYKPRVEVTTLREENKTILTVKDNGKGIPPNIKDKIFQPFFTTKPTGEGTGLGLSLSYDIVKAHGGEIKLESLENEGAKFILQLPSN